MAEDHWSPGADVIDVFIAIDIEDGSSFGPFDEQGCTALRFPQRLRSVRFFAFGFSVLQA